MGNLINSASVMSEFDSVELLIRLDSAILWRSHNQMFCDSSVATSLMENFAHSIFQILGVGFFS